MTSDWLEKIEKFNETVKRNFLNYFKYIFTRSLFLKMRFSSYFQEVIKPTIT